MEKNIEGLLKSEEEKEQGNIFFKNGDYELAIFHYTRSINYVADNSVVYTNRSLAYFKMGAFENSLKDALRAKELDENNLKSYYRICEAYKSLKDIDNYEKYLQLYNMKKNKKENNESNKSNIDKKLLTEKNRKNEEHNKNKNINNNYYNNDFEKEQNQQRKDKIITSNELIDICDNIEEKNPFLFFPNSQLNNTISNIQFEKKKYKNNFLIEEVYDFKNLKNQNSLQSTNTKKCIVHNEEKINYHDIYDDIKTCLHTFKHFFFDNVPKVIHIEKENKINMQHTNYDIHSMKNQADHFFSHKQYYAALNMYNEIMEKCKSEESVFYCSLLSNRSSCFIKMKKIISSLCDIHQAIKILLLLLEKHVEYIKKDNRTELEDKDINKMFESIDIQTFKNIEGIYMKTHKLLIRLLFRYASYSYINPKYFKVFSLNEIDTLVKLNGKIYIDLPELHKLKKDVYSKL
ncbi:tetratricopeptide repeat protein [Plasmodium falciparum NF54]|uniref:Tetratricopeptide repeat protein, putative n=5 Tax=Plasmodium falciparum TaxID=5833 RepID=O96215_PLAF7|nr:tetratricopeptide repeat protein, putative [Plasmodium falciparum 3D7]KAF4331335.1 tetratricopeptide repeat protein [Plasmodium falciparum NF54]PKC46306.1 tetratricopeptide repeat protein [Plasmodium falciparum NF54]CZT98148.1 tetratricopeptide repeat protein, putative [Plasmodium falciparum 3D7]|eukprot:XP_001349640.2 conserved Plasmodium protein, unknown function [Plasmodium falciparum 3D7]